MKTEFCGGGRLAGHNDEQQTSRQTVGKHVVFQHVPTCKRGHAALTRGILSFTCGMIFLSIAAYDSDEPRLQTGWMLPGRSCQGDGMHQCTVPSVLCAGTAALNRCMAMIEQCRHDLHLSSRAAFVGCSAVPNHGEPPRKNPGRWAGQGGTFVNASKFASDFPMKGMSFTFFFFARLLSTCQGVSASAEATYSVLRGCAPGPHRGPWRLPSTGSCQRTSAKTSCSSCFDATVSNKNYFA